ncbi:hypothetical protein [Neobacillus jeddahensis]|uniref:hypothetical protein n=1 Tax=Neobacillus jeddahensis TaxID=1461580 RepID=UPI00058CA199|nr:hypothetical protein [Neobacillus jeddahensis]
MFSEINARIIEIHGELRKKEKYKSQLMDYERELATVMQTISQLQEQFEVEQEDVEKLERISLTNLFATLSGKKDEKLSKEKQEMVTAQHKLEEASKTKIEIDSAMRELQTKLVNLEKVEDKLQQLLLQKEELITSSGSPFAETIFGWSEQEGALKASLIELDEAILAGERAERALVNAIESLENAEDWGTWDIFGGGAISGALKHQHIDEAEDYLHQAQTSMRHFHKELLDVQEQESFEVNISGMLTFADFFFDGFIADYMVQGKINQSLEQTNSHLNQVNDILLKLKAQSEEKKQALTAIQQEKQEMIEKL